MKIAVLSDTHGLLRPQVIEQIQSCDALIHAGDIDSQKIIDEIFMHLKPRVPVYFVRGNNDGAWASHLLKCQRFTLDGVSFCVVHDKKDVPWNLEEIQIVIYGHTHKYAEEEKEGRLWLNPGSCGRRRFFDVPSMAILYLESEKWRVEKIECAE